MNKSLDVSGNTAGTTRPIIVDNTLKISRTIFRQKWGAPGKKKELT